MSRRGLWRRRAAMVAWALTAVITCTACGGSGPGSPGSSKTRPHTGDVHPPQRVTTVQTDGTIPRYLRLRARPIGKGPRFRPPLTGHPSGACTKHFGRRYQAHIELFGANRVVLLPPGIGTGPPRKMIDGQLTGAGCFGRIVSLNSLGIIYVRRAARRHRGPAPTLGELFSAWGQPLTRTRIASFTGGRVRTWVNGRRVRANPRAITIGPRDEIVIEVGRYVPPHTQFAYPPIPDVR